MCFTFLRWNQLFFFGHQQIICQYADGVGVFIFDCSLAHEAFASDALLAHKMNWGPGGAQPMMHDTINPMTKEQQSMVFPSDYSGKDKDGNSLAGKPKGMEQVLHERGLLAGLVAKHGGKLVSVCATCKNSQAAWDAAMKEVKAKWDEIEGSGIEGLVEQGASEMEAEDLEHAKDCCMQQVLSLQPDFQAEKPLLQLVIKQAGHKCLFLPKFHCELNLIEMVWGQAKCCTSVSVSYFSKFTWWLHNNTGFRELSDGKFPWAKELVPQCLDKVTTSNIRHYFCHCYWYLNAYRSFWITTGDISILSHWCIFITGRDSTTDRLHMLWRNTSPIGAFQWVLWWMWTLSAEAHRRRTLNFLIRKGVSLFWGPRNFFWATDLGSTQRMHRLHRSILQVFLWTYRMFKKSS